MKLTKEQVNKKYKGRYVEVSRTRDYQNDINLYEVGKTYKEIHENTTLGEDVGTPMAYRR